MDIKSKKIGCIIQARMNSIRFPNKVMAEICGKPILEHIVNRIKQSRYIQKIVIATSFSPADNPIRDLGGRIDIPVFSGDEEDVLSRYRMVAKEHNFEIIVRVTADDPLIDIEETDRMIKILNDEKLDYASNSDISLNDYNTELPIGLSTEVISRDALFSLEHKDLTSIHREHVTPYIEQYPKEYRIKFIKPRESIRYKGLRLTVDTINDFNLIKRIYIELYKGTPILNDEVVSLVRKKPELLLLNSGIKTEFSYLDDLLGKSHD